MQIFRGAASTITYIGKVHSLGISKTQRAQNTNAAALGQQNWGSTAVSYNHWYNPANRMYFNLVQNFAPIRKERLWSHCWIC